MRTYDPGSSDDTQELREIAFYWLHKAYIAESEKKGLMQVMKDRGIEVTVAELHEGMNKAAGHGA